MLDRITKIMRERGLTQHEFERRVCLPINRITKWIAGQGEPTARQALRIARELDVPLEWLVDEESGEVPERRFSEEEERCVWALRSMGISPADALKRVEIAGRLMVGSLGPREAEESTSQHDSGKLRGQPYDPETGLPEGQSKRSRRA